MLTFFQALNVFRNTTENTSGGWALRLLRQFLPIAPAHTRRRLIMMRFGNEKGIGGGRETRSSRTEDRLTEDSMIEAKYNSTALGEAQFENKARAKRTIMYKTGLGVATVALSLIYLRAVSIEVHSFQWYATHHFCLFKQS